MQTWETSIFHRITDNPKPEFPSQTQHTHQQRSNSQTSIQIEAITTDYAYHEAPLLNITRNSSKTRSNIPVSYTHLTLPTNREV